MPISLCCVVYRAVLASAGYFDPSRRISRLDEGSFALPITPAAVDRLLSGKTAQHDIANPDALPFNGTAYTLIYADLPMSKKAIVSAKTAHASLRSSIQQILNHIKPPIDKKKSEELVSDVPLSWERHGDLVVLPSQAFKSREWKEIVSSSSDFWSSVAAALDCKRLARGSEILPDKYRSSAAEMLLGTDPWVEHIDNGIKYFFDVTQIMFSSGNIAEKIRVSQFDCTGETVVDLYAGIGYFTLPYLVHTHAKTVHACEWNKRAVEALKKGLVANGVEERCIIHVGDCREVSIVHQETKLVM